MTRGRVVAGEPVRAVVVPLLATVSVVALGLVAEVPVPTATLVAVLPAHWHTSNASSRVNAPW